MVPPHAEAHDSGCPGRLELVDGGLGIAQHRAPIRIGDKLARFGNLVRRVAALKILHLPVEQCRSDGGVAFTGQTVADRANVMIDPENLLDDYDAALGGAGRVGAIGSQLKLVG